jgi:hypothetical protein
VEPTPRYPLFVDPDPDPEMKDLTVAVTSDHVPAGEGLVVVFDDVVVTKCPPGVPCWKALM